MPRPVQGSRRPPPRRPRARPRRGAASRRDRPPRRDARRPRAPAAQARPAPPPAAARPGSKRMPISRASPSRSRPHAASTTASSPRSVRLRRRVSMLPRSGSIESDGSSASSCALRRTDAVPTRIPGRIASAPTSASRGSSRSRYAPTTRPSGSDAVMSFAECTAMSMRCSSSASSSSLTKTPREPISPNGFVRSRSPAVVIGMSAISMPGARRRAAARSACVSASLLPRLPTRISTARALSRRLAAHRRTARPHPHERRRQPAAAAACRSACRPSALVLAETEEVPHRLSINHPVGRHGRLFHANGRQVQELVHDLRRSSTRPRAAGCRRAGRARLPPCAARPRGSPPRGRGARRSPARRRATPATRGTSPPPRRRSPRRALPRRAGRRASPATIASRSSMS